VLLLVSSDLADSATNPVGETGGGKVLGRELVEVLLVEGGLQVLQSPVKGERQVVESVPRQTLIPLTSLNSQSVLKNGSVSDSALPLLSGRGGSDKAQGGDGGDNGGGELHYELVGWGCC
jgi:hypothetical protein